MEAAAGRRNLEAGGHSLKHNLDSIAPGAFAMISVLNPFPYKLIQVDCITCKEILKHKNLCVTGP